MDQGVIANFKVYYLRLTFRLLFHAIDGPSQESISSFWKNFNMKKAVENIGEAWEDVTNNSIKFAWRKVWPDVCHDFTGFEVQESITRDIVQLANQAGLTAVDINDVEELLASHGSSLTNEELQELDEHRKRQEAENTATEEAEPEKFLSTKNLTDVFLKLSEVLAIISNNDPDMERSNGVKRAALNAFSCNDEMLREKKSNARQTTLDAFFTKEAAALQEDEPEPGSSSQQ